MTKGRWLQAIVITAVIVGAVGWLSGWFEEKIPAGGPVARPAAPAAGTLYEVRAEQVPAVEWASGSVESSRRTSVAARVLARIEQVRVSAGDSVRQGDVLIRLDARDLEARLRQAEGALRAAEASRDLARTEAERAEDLLRRGVATRQRVDQTGAALRVAEAEVERGRRTVDEARAALSYAEIKAPVGGRIVDRLAEPGDTAAPGQPLLAIYDPAALRVAVAVRESLAVALKVGDRLAIEVAALERTSEGEIEEIVPYAEPGARTLLVRVRLPGNGATFAGMFARVAIPAGSRTVVAIPAEAVERIGQLAYVTAVGPDRAAARRLVTVGQTLADGRVEVLSGLKDGERIVVR